METIVRRIEDLKRDIERFERMIAENPIENKAMKELIFNSQKSLLFNEELLKKMKLI